MNGVKNLLSRHFWKFLAGLLGILAIGFSVIYITDFYAKKQTAGEAKILESKNPQSAR